MDAKELNILLVDDDEVDVITVQRAFAQARITDQLYIARDGIEALQMLRTAAIPNHRRLVLLDLNMPKMSGIEFLREVRSDPDLKTLAVVVMTTSLEDRDRIEAFELNVAGYVVKPLTFQGFSKALVALNEYWALMQMV